MKKVKQESIDFEAQADLMVGGRIALNIADLKIKKRQLVARKEELTVELNKEIAKIDETILKLKTGAIAPSSFQNNFQNKSEPVNPFLRSQEFHHSFLGIARLNRNNQVSASTASGTARGLF